MTSAIRLEGATLTCGTLTLGPLDLEVQSPGVTVLLGPAATGKSTLLRALAGRLPDDASWIVSGQWLVGGRERSHDIAAGTPIDDVFLHPQPPRGRPRQASALVLEPAGRNASLLLLDEPERHVDPAHHDALAAEIRRHAATSAVLLVTHDLGFARTVGDDVLLLAAGRVIGSGPVKEFFEHPPTPAAERFVRDGNCWPEPAYTPPLPSHFHWIIPGLLAGMAYPGLLGDEEEELEAIARRGIEILVTTTHDPFPRERLRAFGIEGRHLPIRDMGVPAERHVASLCAGLERALAAKRGVAIHCKAGLGRTGLVLASLLVWRGDTAQQAIARVRAIEPRYIQTESQERFVEQFARSRS